MLPPSKFLESLRNWLGHAFPVAHWQSKKFQINNSTFTFAIQEDSFNCGLCATSTIAHNALKDDLFNPKTAIEERNFFFRALSGEQRRYVFQSLVN